MCPTLGQAFRDVVLLPLQSVQILPFVFLTQAQAEPSLLLPVLSRKSPLLLCAGYSFLFTPFCILKFCADTNLFCTKQPVSRVSATWYNITIFSQLFI